MFSEKPTPPPAGISVIVPAFNEQEGIGEVLHSLSRVLIRSGLTHEIIVVNDGSTDRTQEAIETLNLSLRCIRHPQNKGYGAALKSGIKKALYDWIVIIDADGTYPQEAIPLLVQTAWEKDWDMVVGSRDKKNAHIPWIRKPAKRFLGFLASYLSGTPIPDLNSGLRVINKKAVKSFFPLLPEGFSFTSTITLALLTNGYGVAYIPIDYYQRQGKSKIKPIRDPLNFLKLIIRMVLYFDPLKIFIPVTAILIVLAFAILIGSFLLTGKAMDVTFGVFLMSALEIFVIGMLADLIVKRLPLNSDQE
jgi:glycosyltransferase involved in cell wall biosynthesis